MGVLGAAVDLQQHHRHPGLRRPHHQVRPLHEAVAEAVADLGLEAEPVADPGAVEFGGCRGDCGGVVVVAGAERLPGDRVVPLLAQCRDPYALRLQQLLRLAVSSLGQHPYLPLVVPDRFDPHQVVVLQIQETLHHATRELGTDEVREVRLDDLPDVPAVGGDVVDRVVQALLVERGQVRRVADVADAEGAEGELVALLAWGVDHGSLPVQQARSVVEVVREEEGRAGAASPAARKRRSRSGAVCVRPAVLSRPTGAVAR
ncbi:MULTISPECIES: hypothetical protein [unclassified Streptomyces]|uniref:hypothetical protein n=1 Tax=unclassified Streptomyces TaxID=2593676 RepID=UPI00382B61C6